jgi:hypothetical protein
MPLRRLEKAGQEAASEAVKKETKSEVLEYRNRFTIY